jgi:hypothetical protein
MSEMATGEGIRTATSDGTYGDERRVSGDLVKCDMRGGRRTSPRSSRVALRQIAAHPSLVAVSWGSSPFEPFSMKGNYV